MHCANFFGKDSGFFRTNYLHDIWSICMNVLGVILVVVKYSICVKKHNLIIWTGSVQMTLKTESIPSFRCSVCTLFLTHLVKGAHPNRNKRGRDDSKKEVIQIRKLIENHVCEEPVLVVIQPLSTIVVLFSTNNQSERRIQNLLSSDKAMLEH